MTVCRAALPVPAYAMPDVPAVAAPTVAEVAAALGRRRLLGDDAGARPRRAATSWSARRTCPMFLDHLADGCLVITPGDRADLIVAAFAAHAAGASPLAGMVLTLGEQPDPRGPAAGRAAATPALPVLLVRERQLRHRRPAASRIEAGSARPHPRKVEAALGAFESHVDTDGAGPTGCDVARSSRVTPLMFEHELIDRARADRRHSCCRRAPRSGSCGPPRSLLRRGVAELTLLGDAGRDRAGGPASWASTSRGARPGRPGDQRRGATTSPRSTRELRAHKGVTLDAGARHGRATSTTSAR